MAQSSKVFSQVRTDNGICVRGTFADCLRLGWLSVDGFFNHWTFDYLASYGALRGLMV
jgi:hypothetical protein